jgi:hypothetical protein
VIVGLSALRPVPRSASGLLATVELHRGVEELPGGVQDAQSHVGVVVDLGDDRGAMLGLVLAARCAVSDVMDSSADAWFGFHVRS